jgi:hypothetical protein
MHNHNLSQGIASLRLVASSKLTTNGQKNHPGAYRVDLHSFFTSESRVD